jgi:hypothetical protein
MDIEGAEHEGFTRLRPPSREGFAKLRSSTIPTVRRMLCSKSVLPAGSGASTTPVSAVIAVLPTCLEVRRSPCPRAINGRPAVLKPKVRRFSRDVPFRIALDFDLPIAALGRNATGSQSVL